MGDSSALRQTLSVTGFYSLALCVALTALMRCAHWPSDRCSLLERTRLSRKGSKQDKNNRNRQGKLTEKRKKRRLFAFFFVLL